jgi:hypothetical protein
LFQWRGNTGEQISVEGFLHWVKEKGGPFTAVDRATKGEGALSLGAYLIGSFGKTQEELAMYTDSFVLYYLLYLML